MNTVNNNNEMDEEISKLRFSRTLCVRWYGLAEVNKEDAPLRLILLLSGSACHGLKKWLTKIFDKVPGANKKTSASKKTSKKKFNISIWKMMKSFSQWM